ncbi:MAG: ABC transporter permease [Clostridia bacterium]|nr:ABC transporter permease [Clostridia bacterium]
MTIFTIVPLLLIVYFSFTNSAGQFTLENIANITKKEYLTTLLESIGLGALATFICLVVGYPVAYMISRMSEKVQATMTMVVMLPMWMNFLLRIYAWMNLLETNGLINRFLGLFGIAPLHMMNTRGAVVLGMVYNFLPYMILPLYSVMAKIGKPILEAASDLGANGASTFRRVIVPLSIPGIISGITMVFVPSVSTFIISQLLGGSKNALIGDIIDMMFLGGAPNYNMGAALSLVLMVLMLLCMLIMNKSDDDEGGAMLI